MLRWKSISSYIKNLPVFQKLIISYILVITLPVIGLSLLSYNFERQNAINLEMASLANTSQKLASNIDKYLTTNKDLIRLISLNSELKTFLLNRTPTDAQVQSFNQLLNLQASVSADIDVLYVLDSNGTCIASTDASFVGKNYKFRYYFSEAMLGEIYRSDWTIGMTSGKPGIYLSAPITNNDTTIGVVVLKSRVDTINKIIDSWKYPGGDSYLLNESGIVLSHTRPEYNYSALTELTIAEKARVEENNQFAGKIIVPLNLPEIKDGLNQMTSTGQASLVRYHFQNQDKISALTLLYEQNWAVGVTVPEEKIYNNANMLLRNIIIFLLISLLMLAIFATLVSNLITQPILSLSETVRLFGAGQADVRANVTSRDEIGKLADNFNQMAETITRNTLDLEAKVAERTEALKVINQELKNLSDHDQLTGCYNRHYLEKQIQNELVRSRRYGLWLAVIMCDIDHFKAVNDNYGHVVGDYILKNFGQMLKAMHRENIDYVIRYGGEEFMIILPQTNLESAKVLTERLRIALENRVFNIKDQEVRITASFGIAVVNYAIEGKMISQDELFAYSDEMLYKAKNSGRNCMMGIEL